MELEALCSWVRRLGYIPSGRYVGTPAPTEDDFAEMRRGAMAGVWAHFSRVVVPEEAAQRVHGNLAVARAAETGELGAADMLRAEIRAKRARARQLEEAAASARAESTRLRAEIDAREGDVWVSEGGAASLARRAVLLDSFRLNIEQKGSKLAHYRRHLVAGGEGADGLGKSNTESGVVARDCERYTERLCDANSAAPEASKGEEKGSRRVSSPAPSSSAAPESLSLAPAEFVRELARVARDKAGALEGLAQGLNLSAEAKRVGARAVAEAKGAGAVGQGESGALRTLQELIGAKRREHVDRFIEAEAARNERVALEAGGNKAEAAQDNDDRAVLELEGARAEARALRAELEFLAQKVAELRADRAALLKKQSAGAVLDARVKGFSAARKRYFAQIRQFVPAATKLAREAGAARDRLAKLYDAGLAPRVESIRSLAAELKQAFAEEAQLARSVRADDATVRLLTWTDAQLAPLAAAGCHVERFAEPAGPVRTATDALGFDRAAAPSRLMAHAVALRRDAQRRKQLRDTLLAQDDFFESLGPQSNGDESARRGRETVQKFEQLRAVLEKATAKLDNITTQRVPGAERNVRHWFEQPAQFATPWIRVDGKTLPEWKEALTSAKARLQALLVSNAAQS